MDSTDIRSLLRSVQEGRTGIDDAVAVLRTLPFETIPGAHIDHHRTLRTAIPEVIFGQHKKAEDIVRIAYAMAKKSKRFLITRTTEEVFNLLDLPDASFNAAARTITYGAGRRKRGRIAVISAGTSDMAVAEEAAVTASFLGSAIETIYDIGVAGIHRLFSHLPAIEKANVVVVVAGMEGALPSVLGGLVAKPVVAVPTSIGYGVTLGGLTALFAMLNSCVPGLAVVNIDNGFGAGCLAHKINCLAVRKK
ncbi:MAG TPA: nickel pincer cofactor biosynthesis protein LarB [Dissulfurispiraceae bacterium]|nr:nickel pincer cofactor biosynthesis protein LarB [Dissulfurispiraceae bacterium]